MAITYQPDVSLHGRVRTAVDDVVLRAEPSLTLCTIPTFAQWAGPVSRRVFSELARTSAFERIAARAVRDATLSVRVSVYVVWLEAGEFPSHRADWHIDRIGGLRSRDGVELVDLRDPVAFPSFLLTTIFLPAASASDAHLDSRSTEFLLSTFPGSSGELWADMREMHVDIDRWLADHPHPPVLKAGDRMIAGFSPRTVHRPGQAAVPGWSYLMRLGLYTATEPCSPYPDHFVFYNPVFSGPAGKMFFRRVGATELAPEPATRSVPLTTTDGMRAAHEFMRAHALSRDGGPSSVEAEVEAAAVRGLQQLSLVGK